MNHFFQTYAGQNQWRHHVGATYVAEGGGAILGYSSVSLATIELGDVEAGERRGLPRYSLPALRLARLAASVDARGSGVGRALLAHAMGLSLELRAKAGCVALVVDAKPGALAFYGRFGFKEFASLARGAMAPPDVPRPMYLKTATIERALAEAQGPG